MQILTVQQVREWDQFTIQQEPVSSIDLMERAATRCVEWIEKQDWQQKHLRIFCGKGNNGGDGLAIARLLLHKQYSVFVYILENGKSGSTDFEKNLERLNAYSSVTIHFLRTSTELPIIQKEDIIVDALFGSGLNKPLNGFTAEVVKNMKLSRAEVVSIDVPSGLFLDEAFCGNTVVKANATLTFQCYKLGLLLQENAEFIGDVHVLDIGLHPAYLETIHTDHKIITAELIKSLYKPRNRFSHKGTYGHALLIAGSYGKMGAAVLATKACLRSGAGLTTACIPKCGYNIMQVAAPEAMTITDSNENFIITLPEDIEKYSSIGIGPGIRTGEETQKILSFIVRRYQKTLVIDADGLNCLSLQKELLDQLPPNSILTPHPKEFERLFGVHANDFKRIETAREKAKQLNIIIVLKSHHSFIALPDGSGYFNTTGNSGMATAGSGDVLTGIITALLAQGYTPADAALFGVYMHGLAGDLAAKALSKESMIAGDLVDFLPKAFQSL